MKFLPLAGVWSFPISASVRHSVKTVQIKPWILKQNQTETPNPTQLPKKGTLKIKDLEGRRDMDLQKHDFP